MCTCLSRINNLFENRKPSLCVLRHTVEKRENGEKKEIKWKRPLPFVHCLTDIEHDGRTLWFFPTKSNKQQAACDRTKGSYHGSQTTMCGNEIFWKTSLLRNQNLGKLSWQGMYEKRNKNEPKRIACAWTHMHACTHARTRAHTQTNKQQQ